MMALFMPWGLCWWHRRSRVKTDCHDAVMLAKLHRAGELTAVRVPDAAHEAMRDLVRARATAVRVAARHGLRCRTGLEGRTRPSPSDQHTRHPVAGWV